MLNLILIITNTFTSGAYFTISYLIFRILRQRQQNLLKNSLVIATLGVFCGCAFWHLTRVIEMLIGGHNFPLLSNVEIGLDVFTAMVSGFYLTQQSNYGFLVEYPTLLSQTQKQLADTHSELRKVNLSLEFLVSQRTAELSESNEKLKREILDRQLLEAELRESAERFRQMAESIREVFWMTDIDKKELLYISPRYENIWGRTCESLYAQPLSFLDAIHPEDRNHIIASMEKQATGDYDEEYRIIQPDGTIRWIHDRAFPITNETGRVYRIVGIAEDITLDKKAKEEISHALDKEKELNDLKSRFVSMTSHEFRTPLTTILASSELLKYYSHKLSDEKKIEHFHRIQSSVNNMTELLNYILVLGKAEAGKIEFNPTPLDVVQFCRDLTEEMQLNLKNKQPKIVFIVRQSLDKTETLSSQQLIQVCDRERSQHIYNHGNSIELENVPQKKVLVDEKLLRHILTNLLSNAIKYSPEDVAVYFEVGFEEHEIVFMIKDQGIGIPVSDQERLFDSFHRAKNVGNIPGTGLGLTVVKKCVDLHDGKMMVASDVGFGTTFRVSIPLTNG